MQRDVEGELVGGGKLIPSQKAAHDDQVSRAGHGNKFRQALNDGQDNRLINGQSITSLAESIAEV